jgi:hypothetical protein
MAEQGSSCLGCNTRKSNLHFVVGKSVRATDLAPLHNREWMVYRHGLLDLEAKLSSIMKAALGPLRALACGEAIAHEHKGGH